MPFSLSLPPTPLLLPASCGVRLLLWSSVRCPAPPTPGSFPHRALYCSWSIQRYHRPTPSSKIWPPEHVTQLLPDATACPGTFCSFIMMQPLFFPFTKDTQRHRLHLRCLQEDSRWTLSRCLEPKPQAATASIRKVTAFGLLVVKPRQSCHSPTWRRSSSYISCSRRHRCVLGEDAPAVDLFSTQQYGRGHLCTPVKLLLPV